MRDTAAYITVNVTRYSHPRRTHGWECVFRSACFSSRPGEKKTTRFGYGAPQIALLRDTPWHFYGLRRAALTSEKCELSSLVSRVPTLCAPIASCKSRESVVFFHFCVGRASRRFSRMWERICWLGQGVGLHMRAVFNIYNCDVYWRIYAIVFKY